MFGKLSVHPYVQVSSLESGIVVDSFSMTHLLHVVETSLDPEIYQSVFLRLHECGDEHHEDQKHYAFHKLGV